ncbi:Glutathione reductase [Cupriavidus taiwanensis]|nr:Glutathione reductase [Cupriavidus taiwanensis]SOY58865.1 Glutathione reductase [Cupriavidus taiwanensis]SOY80098.1 Glutathione reductase [Cupriavidus taiwanensis]SOZ26648.1 Glutathione reductase [Cupriavidus taiwanensis]SOZ50868.1 Glutathione reductase [Cupriavidus taiwanensis]
MSAVDNSMDAFDLLVIGAGSGGVRAARTAAALGARVAIAEQSRVGGTCVIRGCVPKKLLVTASRYRSEATDAIGFGWSFEARGHNWRVLRDGIAEEVCRLEQLYRKGLENAHVTILDETASVEGSGRVRLASGRSVRAENIIVATGALPSPLGIPGAEHCITSDDVFGLPALPPRIVIVGGGYIALEFAGIFKGLGADVTLLHRGAAVLRGFDADVQQGVAGAYLEQGIRIRFNTAVRSIEASPAGYCVTDHTGNRFDCDLVLNATGRLPNTMAAAGVLALNQGGAIVVDDRYATSVAGVYAIGDAIGQLNLTPVAIRQGQWLAESLFGTPRLCLPDFGLTPTAVFSTPELASVGLTEQQARATLADITVYRTSFRPMRASLAGSLERVMMKLVVDKHSDRVVGLHMLGRDAAEIVQMGAISLQRGITKREFDRTVALHPSVAEEFVTMSNHD